MNLFPAIEIRDVSFSYGKTPVLSHVNMSVRAGDFLAIIGPNGGGKSTLMKLIVGLLNPSAGSVRLFGEKVPTKKISVGYVPQNTNGNLEFPITVEETVATGLLRYKSHSDQVRQALETVKIGDSRRLHTPGYACRLLVQLLIGPLVKIAVQHVHNQHGTCQQRQHRHQQHSLENASFHTLLLIL